MSLYEALEELVGAGVLACAPACDVEVPSGTVVQGGRFIAIMREKGAAAFITPVIDTLSREIWLGRDSRGVPHQVTEAHARALVAVLEMHRPDPQQVAAALEKARSGFAGNTNASEPPSRAIAHDVFARSRSGGGMAESGLWDEIALFLIERLLAHLLDDPSLLTGLKPALIQFLGATEPSAGALDGRSTVVLSGSQPAAAADAMSADPLAALGERHGLSEGAMRGLAESLEREGVGSEQAAGRLEELASWLAETRAQLMRGSNEEADIRRLKLRAAGALGEGDFESAMDALRQVRRALRDGRRRVEERLHDEVQSLRTHMSEEASATARLGELALARADFEDAALHFAEAAECVPHSDRLGAWHFTLRMAEARFRKGDSTGNSTKLASAIEGYGEAMRLVSAAQNPVEWSATNLGLGIAIYRLGEHDDGIEKLSEAAAAFRRAVAPAVSEKSPAQWAVAQSRLGRALNAIADRTGRAATFKEASEAYREALKVLSREAGSQEWALAQMGLGNALLGIEEQQNSRQLLAEAAQAYAEALTVLTRDRNAHDWASAQMNLGNALLGLGELEGLSARLEDAVVCYRQSLKVFSRSATPQPWALAHMNLANALASLGDRDPSATSRLEEAIKAYNQALEVFSREAAPLRWAICQMNLGTTLIRLGERKDKRQHWLSAAAAMVPALDVFETQGANDYADLTRRNLRKFHEQWEQLIGEPAGGTAGGRARVAKAM